MLEVCVDSLEGLRVAVDSGAQQIELSEQLIVGGVTPSFDLIKKARLETSEALIVLVRCREGDFSYNGDELELMLDQAAKAVKLGADGVAVGACQTDRSLNWDFLDRMQRTVNQVSDAACLVVHRVFDRVPDPMFSIHRLIELGYDRILTSGGQAVAEESIDTLRAWQQAAGDRLEILPAGGIHSGNAKQVLQGSGCRQLHGSFTKTSTGQSGLLPNSHEIQSVRRILDEYLNQ